MFYLPLYHKLHQAKCLVVGGGNTAARKIRWLLRADADIRIVSPVLKPAVETLVAAGDVSWTTADFEEALLDDDLTLVVSATNDAEVNRRVYAAACAKHIPVNCVDQPELCTFIFPAIIDRNPIVVAVSSQGSAPTLARMVRGWIETRLPPGLGHLAELGQRMRERVRERFADVDSRKGFWEMLFQSNAAEVALQGDLEGAEQAAEDLLATARPVQGSVALVGAGPGDPELITLKALRLIQQADVLLYDKLANPALLEYARRDAERIYVGKQGPKPGTPVPRPDNRSFQQHAINDLIVEHASAGKNVVRLKGGDPFIYGRGGEELESAMEAGLEVLIVPGITAALGAASYAGIPLTYRNMSQSVRFVTGHRVENAVNEDWPELGRADQTLVIYMGLVGLKLILEQLVSHGCEAGRPAVLVENATLPEQRVIRGTISDLAGRAEAAGVSGPSVAIVGDVVALMPEAQAADL